MAEDGQLPLSARSRLRAFPTGDPSDAGRFRRGRASLGQAPLGQDSALQVMPFTRPYLLESEQGESNNGELLCLSPSGSP
jgi:hypothetical protein